jgi:hypothetical protein
MAMMVPQQGMPPEMQGEMMPPEMPIDPGMMQQ